MKEITELAVTAILTQIAINERERVSGFVSRFDPDAGHLVESGLDLAAAVEEAAVDFVIGATGLPLRHRTQPAQPAHRVRIEQ